MNGRDIVSSGRSDFSKLNSYRFRKNSMESDNVSKIQDVKKLSSISIVKSSSRYKDYSIYKEDKQSYHDKKISS